MIRRPMRHLRFLLTYCFAALCIAALGFTLGSCASTPTRPTYTRPVPAPGTADANRPGRPSRGPLLSSVRSEPTIRVRILRRQTTVTLSSDDTFSITPGDPRNATQSGGQPLARPFTGPLTLRHTAEGFLLTDGSQRTVRWDQPSLSIATARGGLVTVGNNRYPGTLAIVASEGGGTFDVVNHVGMETYLPGVLERELYASWHPTAFRAQAIAARSYALWECTLSPHRAYDLEATEASQVYGGAATSAKAIAAVQDTRGMVIAYRDRVVPAFYSAAHGPRGQSAEAAFPNRVEPIPPLAGIQTGTWDAASSRYKWGPFSRETATLSRRIAAWGRANRHAVASLGTLTAISIPQTSSTGRPASFKLTDSTGRSYEMAPESFRFACNYDTEGLPKLAADHKLYSSDVTVTVTGSRVQFTNGQGFGHGVGLSQWGAQAMALAGHHYPAILAFYYPGSRIERTY